MRREVPGFVGNRLQFAVVREAFNLLAKGVASAEDIDTAITAGPGFRWAVLGPLRVADMGGLDVFHAICGYLLKDLADDKAPPALLARLVKQGRYGAKTGAGIYNYQGNELAGIVRRRDEALLAMRKLLMT